MRSVSTYIGRAKRAKEYADQYLSSPLGFWVAIGKTTSWPVEDSPPLPAEYLSKMPECYGFWYVHKCELVYQAVTGSITTVDGKYEVLQDRSSIAAIAAAKSTRVYIEALINPSDLDVDIKYRSIGLCTQLTLTGVPPTLEPGAFVLASQVSSYFLDWVATFKAVSREPNTDHTIQIIREF